MKKFIFIICAVIFLITNILSAEDKIAGKINSIYGQAKIIRNNAEINPVINAEIHYNDKIETAKGTMLTIGMLNGDEVKLYSDEKYNVKDLLKDSLVQKQNQALDKLKSIISDQNDQNTMVACFGLRGVLNEKAIENSIKEVDNLIANSTNQSQILDLMMINADLYLKLGNNTKAKEVYNNILIKDKDKVKYKEVKGTLEMLDMAENILLSVVFEGKEKDLNKVITDIITTDLAKSGILKLIETIKLNQVLHGQEVAGSGMVKNKDQLIKAGELTGVDYILVGKYNIENDNVTITAYLISTKNAEIIKSWNLEGSKTEISYYSHQLASAIHLFLTNKDIPQQELTTSLNENKDIQNLEDIQVQLGFDKIGIPPFYKTNENMKIYFKVTGKAEQEYYISIISFGADGEVDLLYPNDFVTDNKIKLNTEYTLPGNDSYQYTVYGKPGKNMILAIITEKPLTLADSEKIKKEVFPKLEKMPDNFITRGVKISSSKSGIKKWKIGKAYFVITP